MLSNIFYYLAPRSDIPISNQFDLLAFGVPDIFHIVVYFLETNKAKIIVRRLDTDIGWGVDLKIKIYNHQQSEIYSIGSSSQNYKMVEIETKVHLEKKI